MLTSSQIAEWKAYESLEPFGSENLRQLVGTLCATVVNYSQWELKEDGKKKFFTTDDFFLDPLKEPEIVPEKQKQSVEDMKTLLTVIASASSGDNK